MGGIGNPPSPMMMWIGSLALAGFGIPHIGGFAGFYSKDIILESAFPYRGWRFRLLARHRGRVHDGLLQLAFDLHDLPRRAQGGRKTMAHVHESRIMTVPWFHGLGRSS